MGFLCQTTQEDTPQQSSRSSGNGSYENEEPFRIGGPECEPIPPESIGEELSSMYPTGSIASTTVFVSRRQTIRKKSPFRRGSTKTTLAKGNSVMRPHSAVRRPSTAGSARQSIASIAVRPKSAITRSHTGNFSVAFSEPGTTDVSQPRPSSAAVFGKSSTMDVGRLSHANRRPSTATAARRPSTAQTAALTTDFSFAKGRAVRPSTAGPTVGSPTEQDMKTVNHTIKDSKYADPEDSDTETVTHTMLRQICKDILSRGDDEESFKSNTNEIRRAAYDPSAKNNNATAWQPLTPSELETVLTTMSKADKFENDGYQLANVCKKLPFFRQLNTKSASGLFAHGTIKILGAREVVYRQGEQVGKVYVILSGSVDVRMFDEDPVQNPLRPDDIDNSARVSRDEFPSVVFNSLYDGQVFGEPQGVGGVDSMQCSCDVVVERRPTTIVTKERCVLLEISAAVYLAAIGAEIRKDRSRAHQHTVNILCNTQLLENVPANRIAPLAAHLETFSYRYGEAALSPGERPRGLYVIASGLCQVNLPSKNAKYPQPIELQNLMSGAWFGAGAVIDTNGICPYVSAVEIVVISAEAKFLVLTRPALMVCSTQLKQTIQACLEKAQREGKDPILIEHSWTTKIDIFRCLSWQVCLFSLNF